MKLTQDGQRQRQSQLSCTNSVCAFVIETLDDRDFGLFNISMDYWTANTEKCTRLEPITVRSMARSEYYIQVQKDSQFKDKILLLRQGQDQIKFGILQNLELSIYRFPKLDYEEIAIVFLTIVTDFCLVACGIAIVRTACVGGEESPAEPQASEEQQAASPENVLTAKTTAKTAGKAADQ